MFVNEYRLTNESGEFTLKQHNGKMDKDDLVFMVSRNLGYKRLGKNVESAISNAIQFARSIGVITGSGQISLAETNESSQPG